jgi:hypothetical protein
MTLKNEGKDDTGEDTQPSYRDVSQAGMAGEKTSSNGENDYQIIGQTLPCSSIVGT